MNCDCAGEEGNDEYTCDLFVYLQPATLVSIYPKIKELIDEDFEGGRYLHELNELHNAIRSHLQHNGVFL